MELISRKEAKDRGLLKYYTGVPCKHGHLSERLTRNSVCYECKLIEQRNYKKANREHYRKLCSDYKKRNPKIGLLERARFRAKRANVPFTITTSDIDIPSHCPILGIPLEVNAGGVPGPNSPSLDRIIPTLGYTPDNTRVISFRANTIKNDASIEELEAVIAYIRQAIGG